MKGGSARQKHAAARRGTKASSRNSQTHGPTFRMEARLTVGILGRGERMRREGHISISVPATRAMKARQGKFPPKLARFARDPEKTVAALAALGHPDRLRILLTLLAGNLRHSDLAGFTRLAAGPLYHHLDRLRMAGLLFLVARNEYAISPWGREWLLGVLAIKSLKNRRS